VTRRYFEIDALKVAGIATVVLIHAVAPPWDPAPSALEFWLQRLTRFGVPAFLFASGFLYATRQPIPAATTLRRLRRVAVPYAIASAGAQLWWAVRADRLGLEGSGLPLWADLAFGSSFGPYYYAFVIALLIAATPLLAHIPRPGLAPLLVLLLSAQWAVDAAGLWPLSFYWHLRNPLLWAAYLAAGWVARLSWAAVEEGVTRHRRGLGTALALGVAASAGLVGSARGALLERTGEWLGIWAILGLIFVLTCGRGRSPTWLRRTSDATYAVYLFHLFFLYETQLALGPRAGDLLGVLLPWAAGLAGSLLLVAGVQRAAGRRSRDLIGA
jgi:surface polysaccharide O-acyltransferase-like enzyme